MSSLHLGEAKHYINIMYHLAPEEKPSPDKRGLSSLFSIVQFTLVQPSWLFWTGRNLHQPKVQEKPAPKAH